MLKHIDQTIKSHSLLIASIHCTLTSISCIISYICLFNTQVASVSLMLTDITTALDILRGWYGF